MGRYRFGSDFGGGSWGYGWVGFWFWHKICKKEKKCSVRVNLARQSTSYLFYTSFYLKRISRLKFANIILCIGNLLKQNDDML